MKTFFIAISLCVSMNVMAVEFTLQEVRYDDQKIYFFPNEAQPNPKECEAAVPFVLSQQQEGYEQIYSMSLTALGSGLKMQCWLSGCTNSAWGGTRPQVYACGIFAK